MSKCKLRTIIFVTVIFCMGFILLYSSPSRAVPFNKWTWMPLPPYNTLWPLWSPALSPINPITLLPDPIVNSLTPNTVLPSQPGLTWDPLNKTYPWLLYNTPLGMAYYDPYEGINMWPPSYLLDPVLGTPLPIDLTLVVGWSTLAPTSTTWLALNVPVANSAYYNTYPSYGVAYEIAFGGTLASFPLFAALLNPPPAYPSLLTPALLLGLP
ncbi:MAG: hypothetical protein ACMUJM_06220 [bacterium]